jgi:hypothetical protein
MRARGSAQATVRDHKIDGGGTKLRDGLTNLRSRRALRRHRAAKPTTTRPILDTRRREAPSRRVGYTTFVAILRDAALRAAPQDEVVCESAFYKSEY